MTGRRASDPAFHPQAFSVPPVALLLPVVLIAIHALTAGTSSQGVLFESFGLNPLVVRAGGWELLFTHMFLHGSWMAVVVNALLVLVCGASLARAMGQGGGAMASFLAFFLICGVASGLIFCLLHMRDNITVVGASGAMCGLLGAAMRLPMFNEPSGQVNGLLHPRVVIFTVLFCIYSAVIALSHGGIGQARQIMDWEGHLAGYFAGLLLVGPWLRLFHHQSSD